jgi:GDP-4-dehydro-6-deoxy-D-mannose reductase
LSLCSDYQMEKCLITGCNGFVGSHLAEFLVSRGVNVYGAIHRSRNMIAHLGDKITTFECEMLDKEEVENVVSRVKPDLVFHLAAQSRVTLSWQDPEETFKANILGTLYLLEAMRKAATDSLVVVVCSAAEYGYCEEDGLPIREDNGFKPSDPYAVSKVAQDLLARVYWQTYGLRVIRVRPFNITGPGMTGDACSDFATGIVEIENGQREALNVGDLDSIRDITDVRDAVEALWLVAERGTPGEVYNMGSGAGYRIGDLLDRLVHMSSSPVRVLQDNAKIRGPKQSVQIGDNKKLCDLGWRPLIPIEKTLSDVLDYRRKTCSREETIVGLLDK